MKLRYKLPSKKLIFEHMIIKENETLRGIVTVSEDTDSEFYRNETNTWTTVGIRVAYLIR